jgi:hypothetical protein
VRRGFGARGHKFSGYRIGTEEYLTPRTSGDPVEAVMQSRRPTKARIERAFRKLNTDANNARYPSETDRAKERNEQLYGRLLSTKWAALAENEHKRVSETIRKRHDKLRETSTKTKVDVRGSVAGVGLGVGGEKQTTKEPPPQ